MVLLSTGLGLWEAASVSAIVHQPSPDQIQEALDKGRDGVRNHTPPNRLYWRFGSDDDFLPYGFLMTKLSGVAVLSGHFALRGKQPSSEDIQRVLHDERLQVVVMMFGETPAFAQDSYLLLKQGERVIKPDRIRFDARASMITSQEGEPRFRAKVVASFPYGIFDPEAPTTIHVFPGSGGQMSFELDFSAIP